MREALIFGEAVAGTQKGKMRSDTCLRFIRITHQRFVAQMQNMWMPFQGTRREFALLPDAIVREVVQPTLTAVTTRDHRARIAQQMDDVKIGIEVEQLADVEDVGGL